MTVGRFCSGYSVINILVALRPSIPTNLESKEHVVDTRHLQVYCKNRESLMMNTHETEIKFLILTSLQC
jgi:hypothetical protein